LAAKDVHSEINLHTTFCQFSFNIYGLHIKQYKNKKKKKVGKQLRQKSRASPNSINMNNLFYHSAKYKQNVANLHIH